MHPEFWTIPVFNYAVKSYGLMLMIGFLSAVYLAAKRAEKVRANPDMVINLGFFALIGGVVGARLFYVIHYWDLKFAHQANPIIAILDVSQGGMEFLGGFIGAFVMIVPYIIKKKIDPVTKEQRRDSIRLYLDILTPGLMWGLAFGRIGCLLNGCCFGGICAGTVAEYWGLSFPFGSPVYVRQYQNRQIEVPAPLLFVQDSGQAFPLSRQHVGVPPEKRNKAQRQLAAAKERADFFAQMDPDSEQTKTANANVEKLKTKANLETQKYARVNHNLRQYPSTEFAGQTMTPSELETLAAAQHSAKVHPTQIYSAVNALLASIFLTWVFRVRKRHGMVFAVWLLTYPWTRIVIELIRVDNPKDAFGLTISQSVSLGLVVAGAICYLILRSLPERSPCAVPWIAPPEEKK